MGVHACEFLTVTDGPLHLVLLHVLAYHSPLREHGVRANAVHVEAAPGSKQLVCADIALVPSNRKVPVRQSECRVPEHVLRANV